MKQFFYNIQTRLSNIPSDKLLHFFYGSVLVGLFDLFIPHVIITFVCVGMIAITKELYDDMERNSPASLTDVFFTVLPALINMI